DAFHRRLATELAFGAYLLRDARDFSREGVELVDHRVDRALQLQHLAFDVHRNFFGQVTLGHRRRHLGDVAHLAGEIRRELVHVVGEVLPHAGDTRHLRLTAELAVRAHFLRDARYLAR